MSAEHGTAASLGLVTKMQGRQACMGQGIIQMAGAKILEGPLQIWALSKDVTRDLKSIPCWAGLALTSVRTLLQS